MKNRALGGLILIPTNLMRKEGGMKDIIIVSSDPYQRHEGKRGGGAYSESTGKGAPDFSEAY